jgi:hypothetical protein
MATTRRTSAVGFRHRPTGRNFRKRLGNIQRLRNRLLSLTEGLPCLFRQRRLNLSHGQQVFRREDGVGGLGSRRHGSPVYVCRWSFCSERRLRLNRLHPNGSSGFRPPLASFPPAQSELAPSAEVFAHSGNCAPHSLVPWNQPWHCPTFVLAPGSALYFGRLISVALCGR